MRPDAEEMAKVATLFAEETRSRLEHPTHFKKASPSAEVDDANEVAGNGGPIERLPSLKRSLGMLTDGEQTSPKQHKRHHPEPTTEVPHRSEVNFGEHDSMGSTGLNEDLPTSLEYATADFNPAEFSDRGDKPAAPSQASIPTDPPTSALPMTELPGPTPSGTTAPVGEELTARSTKRKRQRVRQKPKFPVDHPLGANDSYPFFTDGKPETKLWFQDRDVYTYWVRRGLLSLQECGIEPEDGVEVST
jgi:hypothetical protein